MKTEFKTLFTLSVAHQYYGTADCTDFDFVMAEHSQQALSSAKLLARVHEGRLHVLFEADDDGHPLRDIAGLELMIGLRLGNPYLEYFSDALPAALPLYTNTAVSLNAPQAADLVERLFTPAAALPGRPLTIRLLRAGDDALMRENTVAAGENMPTLDLRSWPRGCYRVEQKTSAGTISRPLVLSPDLADIGIWGIVVIRIAQQFWEDPAPPHFQIAFQARSEKLDYYVVAPAGFSDFDKLSVTASSLAFEKLAPSAFPADGISAKQLGVPTSQAVLFRSKLPVARSATPTLKVQLKRNGDTLVKNLPLPSADMPLARFVVHLSKP